MGYEPSIKLAQRVVSYAGKKIKIGLVGAGNIAKTHLDAYKNIPSVDIVAICDIDRNHLESTSNLYAINKSYDSIEAMIENENLDAVDICTWNCAHSECAIYALNKGLDVFCEKPMALNANQALNMKAAAEKNEKILIIGFVLRFSEETELAQEYASRMGDIYYSKAIYLRRHGAPGGWFCDKEHSGGGPVIDLGVHVIDQTRYIMGSPKPVSVYAMTNDRIGIRSNLKNKVLWKPEISKFDNGVVNVEDFGTALIRYDNGAVTLLETSYSLNGKDESRKEIYGTEGGLILGDIPEFYSTENNRLTNIKPVLQPNLSQNIFTKELSHFADCVLNKTKCAVSADDGIWVMKIIDAIYKSAKCGHEVLI